MTDETSHAEEARTAAIFACLDGELSADERARFEATLGRSGARAELADWRELRSELESRKQQRAPDAGLDAFTRQMRLSRPPRRAGIGELLERWMRPLYSPPRFAAALVLVLVQAGFLAALLTRSGADELAGDPSTTQVRSIGGPAAASLRVSFRLDATAREIASALSGAGARIVDGPGQGGFYTLRVADKSRGTAIAMLRNSTAVDEIVEGPNAAVAEPGKVPVR